MDTVYETAGFANAELPSRISARGVIAGVLVALALAVMLMVLGAAVGLSAFAPRGDVAKGLGIGYAAWVLLTLVVSAFFGGWVATGAAHAVRGRDGVLHGVVTWAAVTVLGVALVGGAVRGAIGGMIGVGKTAITAGAAQQQQSQGQQQPSIRQQIGSALGNATANPRELAATADRAATGAAIGGWSLFAALLLPMVASLLGGFAASGVERRAGRLPKESSRRRREAMATPAPRATPTTPTEPLPSL
jgi:hypothetical protein